MSSIQDIFEAIATEGFSKRVLRVIDEYINDIQNGTEDFPRFNLSEHAGLSKGGAPLIGASIVACYATASLTASRNAEGGQGSPTNWEIDELQERLIEQWARGANLWEDNSEQILTAEFGDAALRELQTIGNQRRDRRDGGSKRIPRQLEWLWRELHFQSLGP